MIAFGSFMLAAAALITGSAAAQDGTDSSSVVALRGARIYRSPASAPIDDGVILISGRTRHQALHRGSFAQPTRIVPMPLDIVRAATDEAHRRRRVVVAHPSNEAGLAAAIDGRVDVLAHTTPDGGLWSAALLRRLREARVALIPTLKLWAFELSRRGLDRAGVERFLQVGIGQLRDFSGSGGEVLFGTDVGYMTEYDPSDEYRYMQQAGMSFTQILTALTTAPARRFGGNDGSSGRLDQGEDADLVVLEGDPAGDLRLLARVRAVWRQGRMIHGAERH